MTKVAKDYVQFREIAIDDIPDSNTGSHRKRRNRWEVFIEEFIAAEFQAVEVNVPEGKKAHYEYNSLRSYLKRVGMLDLFTIVVRGNQMYVINKEATKTKKTANKRKAISKKTNAPKKKGRPRKLPPEECLVGSYSGVYPGSESCEVDRI